MGSFYFSRSDPLEVAYFRLGKWLLRVLGVWPLDSFSRLTRGKTLIKLGILFTAIAGEIRFAWLSSDEPLTAIDAICPCLTKLVSGTKLVFFIIYRKEMALLLNDLYEYLATECKDPFKKSLVGKVSHFTAICWVVLAFLAFGANFLFGINPIIKWTFQRFTGDENASVWVDLPFQAALPYKDMTRLNNKFLYSMVYFFLVFSGSVTVVGYSGADGAFMSFCMYFSVSYKCLQEDFKQALKISQRTELNSEASTVLYKKLTLIIQRQQYLNEMFDCFNKIYKFMIFVHFFFASIILGMVLVNLKLTSGMALLINIFYLGSACGQLFFYCYGAEKVNQNCCKISETLYFTDWYKCNRKVNLLILFISVKSQRGSLLKAPFFSPSLQLYASIIQTSGSYFTLLQTIL